MPFPSKMALVKLTKENYHLFLDRIVDIENSSFLTPWSSNSFIGEFSNQLSNLWVAVSEEVVKGYVCFWMFDNEIQLVNIAVHPDHRKQGIGYNLVSDVIDSGVRNGIRNLWLEVRPSNSAARSLYDKFGFREVGRRPKYYRDSNEDAIIMALNLFEKKAYRFISN